MKIMHIYHRATGTEVRTFILSSLCNGLDAQQVMHSWAKRKGVDYHDYDWTIYQPKRKKKVIH